MFFDHHIFRPTQRPLYFLTSPLRHEHKDIYHIDASVLLENTWKIHGILQSCDLIGSGSGRNSPIRRSRRAELTVLIYSCERINGIRQSFCSF